MVTFVGNAILLFHENPAVVALKSILAVMTLLKDMRIKLVNGFFIVNSVMIW